MPSWIIPAVVCFFAWGLWGFLPKYALRSISANDVLLCEILGALAVGICVLLISGFKVKLNVNGAAFAIGAGICNYVGILCYVYAIRNGPVSIISAITALYPIFTIAMAYFMLHESISLRQLAGMGLAMVSIILMAL